MARSKNRKLAVISAVSFVRLGRTDDREWIEQYIVNRPLSCCVAKCGFFA